MENITASKIQSVATVDHAYPLPRGCINTPITLFQLGYGAQKVDRGRTSVFDEYTNDVGPCKVKQMTGINHLLLNKDR